ncbi:hypothetical protein ABAC402_04645 [Asticcacaulis sp. AC402]|nr:hypothetical protein ABAC402_04645 [Asticcacaulis sp. AC402]
MPPVAAGMFMPVAEFILKLMTHLLNGAVYNMIGANSASEPDLLLVIRTLLPREGKRSLNGPARFSR